MFSAAALATVLWLGAPVEKSVAADRGAVSSVGAPADASLATLLRASEDDLARNIFSPPSQPGSSWLSVANGGYIQQYYVRDTFLSLDGLLRAGGPFTKVAVDAVMWFSAHQQDDGYLPLWFRETTGMAVYPYCPYDRGPENGGIRQYDHMAEFIVGVEETYRWTHDTRVLETGTSASEKAWQWLAASTDESGLIVAHATPYCGADWADKIQREGYSTFVEAEWYRATRALEALEAARGRKTDADRFAARARKIAEAINRILWTVSTPIGDHGPAFGHYVAWIKGATTVDYFEVDSNANVVAAGIAPSNRGSEILDAIDRRRASLVNPGGAVRVPLGLYSTGVTDVIPDTYQNGGYWYLATNLLAEADRRMRRPNDLFRLLSDVEYGSKSAGADGLAEWTRADGARGGAPNYSWSLATAISIVLRDVVGAEPTPDGRLTFAPCIAPALGPLVVQMSSLSGRVTQRLHPGCEPLPDDR